MSELKPCPLCEAHKPFGTVTPEVGTPSGDSGYRMTIKCRECGCAITRWALKKAWAISSAETAWNRRAQPDDLLMPTSRAQPDNAPLTLEDLREMDGEPVWVITGEDALGEQVGQWVIIHSVSNTHVVFMGGGNGLLLEDYGKTWLAYRRKPEGD